MPTMYQELRLRTKVKRTDRPSGIKNTEEYLGDFNIL